MKKIQYVTGDATRPTGDGHKIIAHICNDQGGWGRGFVVAVSRRWPGPEQMYRMWAEPHRPRPDTHDAGAFRLGNNQYVLVEDDITVANMLAQRGIRHDSMSPAAVDYEALARCLILLWEKAMDLDASVHMPRIGCGLGGGDWRVVEPMIEHALIERSVPVTVYDLPQ